MRRSRTVGRSARAAWVTRAEAAFLARVPVEEVDRWIATGRLAVRRAGGKVFVDLTALEAPAPTEPPVEARSVRGARARSDRALPGGPPPRRTAGTPRRRLHPARRAPRPTVHPATVLTAVAGVTALALLVPQLILLGGHRAPAPGDAAAPTIAPASSTPTAIHVGRDPFASPFGTPGTGDERGSILVKPPGVVRDGDAVAAAATVVNESSTRWLPPSEVTFVARDETGRVIARTTTTVSLGPGRAQTVLAQDLGVDATAIAAIEAHIDPEPLRAGGYRAPSVRVARAAVTDGGKAIEGALDVDRRASGSARLWCAVFDALDELAGVGTTSVDLSRAHGGRLRFWLTAQPATEGPYRASCSVA